jgi:predicted Zn-dependent protease with MMP-like domain
MTYEEFERRAREMFDEIPAEMSHNVDYLVVSEEAVPHPEIPDVYTLGECATGELDVGMDMPESVRSGVHLYYGSFAKLAELDEEFDWEEELWETITHEIRHHRESTAGEDDLEDMDYAEDENFKRREGQPFDPLFFRSGEPVAVETWRVDGDVFIERTFDAAGFERAAEIEVMIGEHTVSVPRPEKLGDVHYVYLDGLFDDDTRDVVLVLIRRRGTWESLRSAFSRKEPEFLESAVDFAEEDGA